MAGTLGGGRKTMVHVAIAFLVLLANSAVRGFHIVFTGPSAVEVQLIAAKLALRSGGGDTACTLIRPSGDGEVRQCLSLMYGRDFAADYFDDGGKKAGDRETEVLLPDFASDGESIGAALATADSIVIACEEQGVDESYVDTLLSNSPRVEKVALLSRHGGKLRSLEESLRGKCDRLSQDVAFSVVRAGLLVGGGPGPDPDEQGEEWGLSRYFYDTKLDLQDAQITQAMDRFTLGARVAAGDPHKAPNFFSRMMAGSSFEPRDGDTGRIAAAHALLAALRRDGEGGVDISISTEKAERPLSFDEWDMLLNEF